MKIIRRIFVVPFFVAWVILELCATLFGRITNLIAGEEIVEQE